MNARARTLIAVATVSTAALALAAQFGRVGGSADRTPVALENASLRAAVGDSLAWQTLAEAAEQGSPSGRYFLGRLRLGSGDPAQEVQGLALLKSVAAIEDTDDRWLLGWRQAWQVDRDESPVYSAKAQLALGKFYYSRAHPDFPLAKLWLQRCYNAGRDSAPIAAFYLARIVRNGDDQLAPDALAARRWLTISAESGLPDAQFLLGQMWLQGEGGAVDPMVARAWFEKAAEQEQPEANLQLLMAQQRGEMGFKRNAEEERQRAREADHSLRHRPITP